MLTQDYSTPLNLMYFQLQFPRTITSSGKQNDNEEETCIVHLMQMYIYTCTCVSQRYELQKSKYLYPAHQPIPDTSLGGSRHLQSFFFKCRTALCDIDY